MNVLIINSNQFKQPCPVIPIGAVCIATSLHRAGHTVELVDLCFCNNCDTKIQQAVAKFRPDLVGVGIRNIDNAGYDRNFLLQSTRAHVLVPLAKHYHGPIVIGGAAVGISAVQMLHYLDVDYAIAGDGELAIVELAKALETNQPVNHIGGVIHRKNGKIVVNNPPYLVADLDSLPTPDIARFVDVTEYKKFDSPVQIQTKRGCNKRCSYCVYGKIEGQRYRLRSPQRVVQDIMQLTETTGIRYVEFTDSTFNLPLDHAKRILRLLIEANLDLKLRTMGMCPSHIDEQLVDMMQQAGFTDIDLGVESCCDAVLKHLGKDYCTADVVRAAHLLHSRGFPVTWFLLLGGPGETVESVHETFRVALQTADKWDLIAVGVGIRLYNGAPLSTQVLLTNRSCTNDQFLSPVLYEPETIALEQIKQIASEYKAKYPNIFMWDEDGTAPAAVMRLIAMTTRMLDLRMPAYRVHIALRMLRQFVMSYGRASNDT